jgi:hypothetical protein
MRSKPTESFEDPDLIETMPVSARDMADSVAPISDAGWDSEAPTAVHSRRPLFAGPPLLPKT